jgi:tetratricopeptide (TPR) repeat protein
VALRHFSAAPAEAAQFCELALRQFGEDANALMILGTIEMQNGDVASAVAHYERARAAMPTHIHVLVNLGSAYREIGRLHTRAGTGGRGRRRFAIAHNNWQCAARPRRSRCAKRRGHGVEPNYAAPVAALANAEEEQGSTMRAPVGACYSAPQILAQLIARTERMAIRQSAQHAEALLREAPTPRTASSPRTFGRGRDKSCHDDVSGHSRARMPAAATRSGECDGSGPMAPTTLRGSLRLLPRPICVIVKRRSE